MATRNHRTKKRSTRGQGSIYQRADGGWTFTLQRRSVSARTKKELQPKIARLRAEVEAGVTGARMSVEAWLTRWLDDICPTRMQPQTIEGYRGYMNRYVIPAVGSRALTSLQPEHVRAIYTGMAKRGLSTATIGQCHRILRRALKVAVMEGKILRNPCDSLEPPRPTETGKTHGVLTVEELRVVLAHLRQDGDLRRAARWGVALLAGLRRAEVLGLDWSNIDLEAGVIRVRQAQTRVARKFGLGPVKSRRSVRDVPIMLELRPLLMALWEQEGKPTKGLAFGPRHARTDYEEWQQILRDVELPRRSVHACRAAFASMMKEAGVPTRVVADLLGHEDTAVTNAHYIHTPASLLIASVAEGSRLLGAA